jgi:VWFA-related protein
MKKLWSWGAVLASIICSAAFAISAVRIPAQSPSTAAPPQQTPQQPPTIRATTRLVQVNVVVLDKKGEPVRGLAKDDFTIVDQGHPQTVALFAEEGSAPRPVAAASAPAPLPPNFFTNRPLDSAQTPTNVTILLFDALNTQIQDQAYARQQILKFLKQLPPHSSIAIYVLTSQIRIIQDFTQDTALLQRAVEKFAGQYSAQLDASTPDSVTLSGNSGGTDAMSASVQQAEDALNAALQRIGDFYTVNRVQATTAALEAIANHVARIPGRKNLIWVSGSFPIAIGLDGDSVDAATRDRRHFGEEIERAARAMNQADLAIYPVDARGLMTLPQFSAANRTPFNLRQPQKNVPRVDQNNFDTMNMLAERTGGHAFYNTNDLSGAVHRALTDSELTYSLGYYPDHGKWDGKFHEIKVHVNRTEIEVRARKGYFATSDPPDNDAERKASLDAAVWSPIDASSLGIQVRVEPAPPADSGKLRVLFALDLHQLLMTESNGRWTGEVDTLLLQWAAPSEAPAGEQKHIAINLEKARYEELLKSGIGGTWDVPIKQGATTLKLIVRDTRSGALGSITIPLVKLAPVRPT